MLNAIAVLAILILPVLAWGNTTRLLKRTGWKWWSRHLAGMALWYAAIFGVFLVTGGTGVFDGEPSLTLSLIGAAVILGILYWFHHMEGRVAGSPAPSKPAKQPKHTPPPRPKPLSPEQRKTLKLKEHVPEQARQRKHSTPVPSATPEPTRAIRTGWALCTIAFEYEDASGQWTERTVTVHSVNRVHFKGECHARHAERTFRLDRIMSDITDIETGEILDVDEWADQYI